MAFQPTGKHFADTKKVGDFLNELCLKGPIALLSKVPDLPMPARQVEG